MRYKRLVSFLLALALLAGLLPAVTLGASAADAAHTITVTVREGKDGDPRQYNYDETPASSVTVYVTVSSDGMPLMGKDGTILAHLPVKVPYFDLANQGLEKFYRYQTKDGRGEYINSTIVRRPTALHLYLYLLGVYYLGYSAKEVTSGDVKIPGRDGNVGVRDMNGNIPYTDSLKALNITGNPTSLYMQQFWGHDENLMYYRNHVYPLMGVNWGSTADYILLSEGDTIDVAMFSNWDFYKEGGAFVAFDQDSYKATTKANLTFRTVQYATKSVADGGSEMFEPVTGMKVALYDEDWYAVAAPEVEEGNLYTLDTSELEPGTYYLMALDPHAGETGETIPATGAHTDANQDGKCDVCGAAMATAVPTRKAGYPAESSGVVKTGMAYLLSDLQGGRVFAPVDGQKLNYTNYYYERSADGGATWSAKQKFSEASFGATTICLTETRPGTYLYRFYASHDGVNFSKDTWTLTLTVSDVPVMNFSFHVGRDYTGGYPVIRLYSVDTDENGDEILGSELQNVFLYSNFTDTCPEGTAGYDPNEGILTQGYQMFYASLTAGRYAYRAFAKNAETGAYDIPLGGMTLDLPTDSNVDGLTGGGTELYLQCVSFYPSTKKQDGTYFAADEYHVTVDCPIMKCQTQMGEAYQSGAYAVYPTMLYAGGNACLYNYYLYADIDGYGFSQNINATFQPGYEADQRTGSIDTVNQLTVTVPQNTTFGLYFQWNNFNSSEVAPEWSDPDVPNEDRWQSNDDGTRTARYFVSSSNGSYTWRLRDDTHVNM